MVIWKWTPNPGFLFSGFLGGGLFNLQYLLQEILLRPQDIPSLSETLWMKYPPVLRWSGLHSPGEWRRVQSRPASAKPGTASWDATWCFSSEKWRGFFEVWSKFQDSLLKFHRLDGSDLLFSFCKLNKEFACAAEFSVMDWLYIRSWGEALDNIDWELNEDDLK